MLSTATGTPAVRFSAPVAVMRIGVFQPQVDLSLGELEHRLDVEDHPGLERPARARPEDVTHIVHRQPHEVAHVAPHPQICVLPPVTLIHRLGRVLHLPDGDTRPHHGDDRVPGLEHAPVHPLLLRREAA